MNLYITINCYCYCYYYYYYYIILYIVRQYINYTYCIPKIEKIKRWLKITLSLTRESKKTIKNMELESSVFGVNTLQKKQ